jgi:hypothetical protein
MARIEGERVDVVYVSKAYSAFLYPAFSALYCRQNSPAAVSVVSRWLGRCHHTIHILLLSVFVLLFCLCSVWGRRVGGII